MDTPFAVRIVLAIVMAGSGLLVMWMAQAAASGQLRRNDIAGIRTPSTMSSDVAWLAAHVRSKRATMTAGILALVTGLVVLIPMPSPVMIGVVMAGCLALLGFVLYGARVGVRAAKQVGERPRGSAQ